MLVNPNIATVQTSNDLADRVYLAPVTPEFVEKIAIREKIDSILLAFGGQTALNCGLALHDSGVLDRLGIRVLGTPVTAIRDTEDRRRFVERLAEIGVTTARSVACHSVAEAREAALSLGLPVMLRGGFSLGGKGSGIVDSRAELDPALLRAFSGGAPQVLVEESLRGWKEIEYEIVRDAADNCITVCNMENFDPMGIHTGESIVVAPSQTLDDTEYQLLRSIAIRTARHLGIIGECNIQFALDPASRQYRVIEVNARLSRSSALASKATGYPLAYVAARIALGQLLPQIPNGVTRKTTAFFEPAMDYIVCKIPRWDLTKFGGSLKQLGSEMKSVGEVMGIRRTFPEALQKALRMLDIGVDGLDPHAYAFDDLEQELRHATPRRVFAVAQALHLDQSVDAVSSLTRIDPWFLHEIASIVSADQELRTLREPPAPDALLRCKRLGFSDAMIDRLTGSARGSTHAARKSADIRPHVAQIDTTAAEFPAVTNYLYSTYHATQSETRQIRYTEDHDPRVGRVQDRLERRVRLVVRQRSAGRPGRRLRDDHDQLQPRDGQHRLRYLHDAVVRRDQPGIRSRGLRKGTTRRRRRQHGWTTSEQPRDPPGATGNPAAWHDRPEHRPRRGPLEIQRLARRLGIEQPLWEPLTEVSDAEALVGGSEASRSSFDRAMS